MKKNVTCLLFVVATTALYGQTVVILLNGQSTICQIDSTGEVIFSQKDMIAKRFDELEFVKDPEVEKDFWGKDEKKSKKVRFHLFTPTAVRICEQ